MLQFGDSDEFLHYLLDLLLNFNENILFNFDLLYFILDDRNFHDSLNLLYNLFDNLFLHNLFDNLGNLNHFLNNSRHNYNFLDYFLNFDHFRNFDHFFNQFFNLYSNFFDPIHFLLHFNNFFFNVLHRLWHLYIVIDDRLHLHNPWLFYYQRIPQINFLNYCLGDSLNAGLFDKLLDYF